MEYVPDTLPARKTGIFLLQPENGRIYSSGFKGTSGWNEPGGIVCVSSGTSTGRTVRRQEDGNCFAGSGPDVPVG